MWYAKKRNVMHEWSAHVDDGGVCLSMLVGSRCFGCKLSRWDVPLGFCWTLCITSSHAVCNVTDDVTDCKPLIGSCIVDNLLTGTKLISGWLTQTCKNLFSPTCVIYPALTTWSSESTYVHMYIHPWVQIRFNLYWLGRPWAAALVEGASMGMLVLVAPLGPRYLLVP